MKFTTLALAFGLMSTTAMAETLKVSSYLPPMHTFNRAIEAWGAELSEASGGTLDLEMYTAAQLAPPPRQFDLVRSGGADIAVILHSVTPGRFPLSELAGLPLTHPSAGDQSAITSRRLTELAPEYLAKEHKGTRILWMAVTPPLKMHFSSVDPSDLSGIKGLRIRYAGVIWQQILEAMGASPVPVPPAETADAMSKGVVDAASFPFEATMAFDLGPVTDYSLEPGLAPVTMALVMADRTWDRLSPEHQEIISATTGPDRAEWYGAMWDASEQKGRDVMTGAGVTIVSLDAPQMDALRADLQPITDAALSKTGDAGAAFLSAYTR